MNCKHWHSLWIIALAVFVSVRCLRVFAVRKALLDRPNIRSSHKVAVPRLGGAAFIPVVFFGLLVSDWEIPDAFNVKLAYFCGTFLLFVVSLADDLFCLSSGIRFLVQLVAAAVFVVFAGSELPLGGSRVEVYFVGILLVFGTVALLNFYNFMDGIDGIAGLQAVIAGLAWWWHGSANGAACSGFLGLAIAAGSFGFLTINWPPARMFMGDAGSTILGYSFAVLPVMVWIEAKPRVGLFSLVGVGVLVVWPFVADGIFTLLCRIFKNENIFTAHRSHLYQRLVVSGRSHQTVTLVYGGLAVVGAILAWPIAHGYLWGGPVAGGVILVLFGGLWRWTVLSELESSL